MTIVASVTTIYRPTKEQSTGTARSWPCQLKFPSFLNSESQPRRLVRPICKRLPRRSRGYERCSINSNRLWRRLSALSRDGTELCFVARVFTACEYTNSVIPSGARNPPSCAQKFEREIPRSARNDGVERFRQAV